MARAINASTGMGVASRPARSFASEPPRPKLGASDRGPGANETARQRGSRTPMNMALSRRRGTA
eukprot:6608940-Pyramimonas_sp.AAC.1